jgi:hypothetical protein
VSPTKFDISYYVQLVAEHMKIEVQVNENDARKSRGRVHPVTVIGASRQANVIHKTVNVDLILKNDINTDATVDLAGEVHRWTSMKPEIGVNTLELLWKKETSVDPRPASPQVHIAAHKQTTVTLHFRSDLLTAGSALETAP